jgi:hypothetical protein
MLCREARGPRWGTKLGTKLGVITLGLVLLAGTAQAAPPTPLGVSYSGWRGGFEGAAARVDTFAGLGFAIVTFIPAYAYVGRNRIDLESGPTPQELGAAVEAALRRGRAVVIKPHLEAPVLRPGYQRALSDNQSWRAECGWRGFFDVDPMTDQYREGVVLSSLRALKDVFARLGADAARAQPIRFELGAELMNSEVEFPARWEALLKVAKQERKRLGLEGRVLLSHNFSHHVEMAEDQVDRLDARGKKALGRYIAGLDALALSQYMDLTVAVPPAERTTRLPTAEEVAMALRRHERAFRQDILQGALGLRPAQIPPLHVGEFGVGSGGLKHPNLWGGSRTPEQELALQAEIARGHEGLVLYLSGTEGRTVGSAVLWVTGTHFDIFGWGKPSYAVPAAAAAIRGYLQR